MLFRDNDRSSKMLMNRLINLLSPLPVSARRSFGGGSVHRTDPSSALPFGRGFEVVSWRELKSGMGTEAWFCDPSAPWQKGSVENLNKRAGICRVTLR